MRQLNGMRIFSSLLLLSLVSAAPLNNSAGNTADQIVAEQTAILLELEKERHAVNELLVTMTKNLSETQQRYRRIEMLETQLKAFEKRSNQSDLTRAIQDLQVMLLTKKESHPEVRAQQRKIQILKEAAVQQESERKTSELNQARQVLQTMLRTKKEAHPDVRAQQMKIKILEEANE